MNVSQSKVRMWRNCRQAFHYRHVDQLVPQRTRRPFAFGKIVHRMVEAHAEEDDPMAILDEVAADVGNAKIFAEEKEMYGDIVADIGTIMENYFDYWSEHPEQELEFVGVTTDGEHRLAEHEFAIPLEELVDRQTARRLRAFGGGVIFKGQVDGLATTRNKLKWLVEHKSFDKLPGDDERWRNLQSVVYARAVVHLGWMKRVDGICWNYIKSKPPSVPEVLKDGSRLSAAKLVTLPSVVRAVLAANPKLDPEHPNHIKLLAMAEASRDEYFQRIFTPMTRAVADNLFDGFVESAIEMAEHGETRTDKNIGRHCGWCDYEPLCRAELSGADLSFVKEHDYTHEDPEAYRRTSRRSSLLRVVSGDVDQGAGPA